MAEKCFYKIFEVYDYYRCGRPGKVQRNGRWYCGIHDPEKVAARRAKREAKYMQYMRDMTKVALIRGKQADAFPALVKALRALDAVLDFGEPFKLGSTFDDPTEINAAMVLGTAALAEADAIEKE